MTLISFAGDDAWIEETRSDLLTPVVASDTFSLIDQVLVHVFDDLH